MGDHTETIEMDFDPTLITYEQLLDVFWSSHRPTSKSSRQYMSAIFYHNDQQRDVAIKTRDQVQAKLQRTIYTEITPATEFYLAEDYHQKYYLRSSPGMLKCVKYSTVRELVDSPIAARLNGYVGGYGSAEQLQREIDSFGLTEQARKQLQRIVEGQIGLDWGACHL